MKEMLREIADSMNFAHDGIQKINSEYTDFNDKQLHFLVIGILGLLTMILIYPLFKWLSKKGHVLTLTLIYVTTIMTVLTVAIEIGQKVTNGGAMDIYDVLYGMLGFVIFFLIFSGISKVASVIKNRLVNRYSRSSGPKGLGHRSDTL
ncbi:MAG: hypothetical protein J6U54_09320 [Clostridiales bacterium]|nr:hypothetical protein [Clostridiales bacterium]